jgi:UDP-N-acetyl-D-mannosaminuronic acid transferase (WecB/TagA/CpsF family)
MQVESSQFEQLLDGSARRTDLFFNLRQAESAPVDLAIIILHSNLKSNERLADLVAAFVKDSDKTAERLFMFGSKVAAVEG